MGASLTKISRVRCLSCFPPTSWINTDFLHDRLISTPFPTHRLASFALRTLRVDPELSSLVRRSFSLASRTETSSKVSETAGTQINGHTLGGSSATSHESPHMGNEEGTDEEKTVLQTFYEATTNRMLRVAVNGFMESLALVIDLMEGCDVDVIGQNVDTQV